MTINHAIKALTSETIYIKPGIYPIGHDVVIAKDVNWIAANNNVLINNSVSGIEGVATQIHIPYPPPMGLIAYYNFPKPIDLSSNYSIGFWFKPSTTLSSRELTPDYGGSPLKILLDDSLNCSSPVYSEIIWHTEWVTPEWKYYKIPGTPPQGKSLPPLRKNIRSIGIEIWDNPSCITPSTPYSIIIDDIHANGGEIRTHSNIRLLGAGPRETILKLKPHSNVPMIIMEGSNVEIAGLQLDGNLDNQDAIDQCIGIYNPSGGFGSKIHHNYIHHTKGGGIKLRGYGIEIYENLIEWTENPCIELIYYPHSIHIHHNTLKYAINDDNIWVRAAHNILIEYNELYGVTTELLSSGDPAVPVEWRNKKPQPWNGIRIEGNSYNVTVQFNKIYNVPGYGIIQCYGHHNTIKFNCIFNSQQHQLAVQNWKGGNATYIQVIGNFVSGGARKGLYIGGYNNTIENNWTKDNAEGGIFIGGTGHIGSGNYAEERVNVAPSTFMSQEPPILPTFKAGITW